MQYRGTMEGFGLYPPGASKTKTGLALRTSIPAELAIISGCRFNCGLGAVPNLRSGTTLAKWAALMNSNTDQLCSQIHRVEWEAVDDVSRGDLTLDMEV